MGILKKVIDAILRNPCYLSRYSSVTPFRIISPYKLIREIRTQLFFERKKINQFEFVSSLLGQHKSDFWNEAEEAPWPLLYVITRLLRPQIIVETGVQEGKSAASFLLALERNRAGELYSVELGEQGKRLPDGHKYCLARENIGYLVPHEFRKHWHLIFGDSKLELPDLLKRLGEINIFFHDSLHTDEHMMFEYEIAWSYLKQGGLLLSDNISFSFRWFAEKVGKPCFCTGDFPKFGGIRK